MAAKRTVDTLQDTFTVMHNLAEHPEGVTVGEMNKLLSWLTRGQIQRILDVLEATQFTYQELVKHGRTGKKLYRLTEHAAIHCAAIARTYSEKN